MEEGQEQMPSDTGTPDMYVALSPERRGRSFGALEQTGSTGVCSSWKLAAVSEIVAWYLPCLEEVTPLTL